MWYCYALISECGKYTYIGKTNNLKRRLRQHNGEISGGAKYTRKGRPWSHILYVSGFPTNSLAMCFEWAWKHKRAKGKTGILKSLEKVCLKEKWTTKCPESCTIPLKICSQEILNITLPQYVTFQKIDSLENE